MIHLPYTMKPATRLKLFLFIAAFILILSLLPFLGSPFNLLGKWVIITVVAWQLSAKISPFLLGLFLQRIKPDGKWVLVSNCDTEYGVEMVKCLRSKFKFKVIAAFRDGDGIFARKLRESVANEDEVKIIDLRANEPASVEKCMDLVKKLLAQNGDEEGNELWALVNLMSEISIGKVTWGQFDEQYKRIIDANVISAVCITRALLPLLRNSHGRVINVTDSPCKPRQAFYSSWNMSNSCMTFFSDCLRKEIFFFGVKVVSVEPDYYCTPFTKEDHLMPAAAKSWEQTNDSLKSKEDWFIVNNAVRNSIESNSRQVCQRVAQSVGTALTTPNQCLEYKYAVDCTLNHSFLWFINVLVPEETQEAVLTLYRNTIGLPQRP